MALFAPKLPAELAQQVPHPRVLANAQTSTTEVFGLADRLVFRDAEGWQQQPWHLIERGGWNKHTQKLSWTTTAGATVELELTKPGRLPQLFQERVNETIAYTGSLALSRSHTAVISARRDLTNPSAPLIWRASPGASTTVEQVAESAVVSAELERLRAEYDLR